MSEKLTQLQEEDCVYHGEQFDFETPKGVSVHVHVGREDAYDTWREPNMSSWWQKTKKKFYDIDGYLTNVKYYSPRRWLEREGFRVVSGHDGGDVLKDGLDNIKDDIFNGYEDDEEDEETEWTHYDSNRFDELWDRYVANAQDADVGSEEDDNFIKHEPPLSEAERKELYRLSGKLSDRVVMAISPIDESIKFSEYYKDCIGIVGFGEEENGTTISFQTHINVVHLSENSQFERGQFKHIYEDTLAELVKRCKHNSISISIFGGLIVEHTHKDAEERNQQYRRAVSFIGNITRNTLGVQHDPVILLEAMDEAYIAEKHVLSNPYSKEVYIAVMAKQEKTPLKNAPMYTQIHARDITNINNRIAAGEHVRTAVTGYFG
jgi:hypothetical protein